jgi:hypothetical protein
VLATGELAAQGGLFIAVRGAHRLWPEGRVLARTSPEEAGHAAAGAWRIPRQVSGLVKVCVEFWCGDATDCAGRWRRRGFDVNSVREGSGAYSKWRDHCARD